MLDITRALEKKQLREVAIALGEHSVYGRNYLKIDFRCCKIDHEAYLCPHIRARCAICHERGLPGHLSFGHHKSVSFIKNLPLTSIRLELFTPRQTVHGVNLF